MFKPEIERLLSLKRKENAGSCVGSKLESKQVDVDETISPKDSSFDESDEEKSVVEDASEEDCHADFEDIDEKLMSPAAVHFHSLGGS